jgi:hypothetical protein
LHRFSLSCFHHHHPFYTTNLAVWRARCRRRILYHFLRRARPGARLLAVRAARVTALPAPRFPRFPPLLLSLLFFTVHTHTPPLRCCCCCLFLAFSCIFTLFTSPQPRPFPSVP